MIGEVNLTAILRALTPILHGDTFVYLTGPALRTELEPLLAFREVEGWTMIVTQAAAEQHGLEYTFPCAWITLHVHSSLAAVGLTAVVSAALADAGIACNMVAAYHHDHVFVPHERAAEAMQILQHLSGG
jgi:hypothetical protein